MTVDSTTHEIVVTEVSRRLADHIVCNGLVCRPEAIRGDPGASTRTFRLALLMTMYVLRMPSVSGVLELAATPDKRNR